MAAESDAAAGLAAFDKFCAEENRLRPFTPLTPAHRPRQAEDQEMEAEAGGVEIIRADSIKVVGIRWLWSGWLAAGKLHLLAGQAGTGKTTIAVAWAATISRGGSFPDGTRCEAGSTLMWSGEDDVADSLVPRFMANGGDASKFHLVVGARDEEGRRRPFDPATDVPALTAGARGVPDLRLVIVDPVVLAVAGDSHKNAEVRRGLQPLVDLAAALGVAVLGITHYSKNTSGRDPLERVTGSLAFGALARVVLGTAKPAKDGPPRRLVRVKSNVGPDGGGFEYELVQHALRGAGGLFGQAVVWGDALEGSARDLFAEIEAREGDEAPARSGAESWLRDRLASGPMDSVKVKMDAEGAGLSWATVRRAQKALGVVTTKDGMEGGWRWRLPPKVLTAAEDAHHEGVSAFGKSAISSPALSTFEKDDSGDVEEF